MTGRNWLGRKTVVTPVRMSALAIAEGKGRWRGAEDPLVIVSCPVYYWAGSITVDDILHDPAIVMIEGEDEKGEEL